MCLGRRMPLRFLRPLCWKVIAAWALWVFFGSLNRRGTKGTVTLEFNFRPN